MSTSQQQTTNTQATQRVADLTQPVTTQSTSQTAPEPQNLENSDVNQPQKPFFSGIVTNSKSTPLPNIMVYVNTHAGELVRILKTNKNGVFASFHALEPGTYVVSPKDLGGNYFFDTMTVPINGPQEEPVKIASKELL